MNIYKRHRFPSDIISYAVWLYYRFSLSHRDVEDLLAEHGVIVSREAIRLWCIKFGALYARRLKRKHQGYGDTFFIDDVFVKINGKQYYLWRAVDQDGEVVDVFLKLFTTRPNTQIIELNSRMRWPVSGSEGCVSSSQWGKPRELLLPMLRFQICSIWVGTW